VLSRLRPDPAVLDDLADIDGPDDSGYRVGAVPATWFTTRAVGEATLRGDYADVGHAASLAYLRTVMAGRLIHHGIGDLDAAAIRLSAPRRFTQEISNHVYRLSAADGGPRFAGIEYESRLGDNYQNWAVFERPGHDAINQPTVEPVRRGDPALAAALAALGLKLE